MLLSENKEELERLIDRYGLVPVIEALTEICQLKAQHIAESWQDYPLAELWDRNAKTLDAIISNSEVI